MTRRDSYSARLLVASACLFACAQLTPVAKAATDLPREWIDADTGHRIVRLSDTPGSLSLYFNFNAYTPQKDKMVFSTPNGISAVDLKTRKITEVVKGKVRLLFTGRTSRQVYYETASQTSADAKSVYAADIDTGKIRLIANLPHGTIQAINADDTVLAGVEEHSALNVGHDGMIKKNADAPKAPLATATPPSKGVRMEQRLQARIPMEIFTIDVKTGARKTLVASTDWLNHLQFSPTDPGLLLYCHEGPWQKVDRLWMIRTDKPDAKPVKLHTRTMAMEIAGHEWFSADGKIIWYDLQTPKGEVFWVAGYEIATGKRTWYHLQRDEWSVHYNVSPDGSMFSGDGGDNWMVAHAPNGKWLYLFRPQMISGGPDSTEASAVPGLVQAGRFISEKLVSMKNHNYKLEPNARFSPDGKWLFFRSDMLGGAAQVYAVELEKAKP